MDVVDAESCARIQQRVWTVVTPHGVHLESALISTILFIHQLTKYFTTS